MQAQTFRELVVWQESMRLVHDVYALSATLPTDERFGLSTQLKRAVVSIPSNIAEGAQRRRRLTFRYHIEVALGSQAELDVQLEIVRQLGFVDEVRYQVVRRRAALVGRLLIKLLDSL